MTYKDFIKNKELSPLERKFYSYQQDIESGKILANKWVKLAVKRFANDFKRQGTDEFPYIFDFSKAERLLQFGQMLKQVNDNWAGKPLVFLPWQVWTLGNIYGWCHKDTGLRRFRKAWLYVTRKSGKSTMIAVTGLWDLLSTNGAQVCTAANTRDQAKIVFNVIKAMVRQNEVLSKRLKVYESTSTIVNQANFGKLEALSSESSKTGDGRNDSLGIFDECSTTDYGIYKVIESGQGQRPEPLNLLISSGSDKLDSMGKQEFDRACKILQGIIQDETYFSILYCLDEKDNWLDESKYIKAQPSLGVTVKPEFLHNLKVQAQQQPSLETEFKTKCLGLWCSPEHAWINYKYWQVCKDNASKFKFDINKTYYANLGIDLSKAGDLTSLTLCCYQEGKYYMRHWLYFPVDSLSERIKSETEMWRKWFDDGLVIGVPGKTIDYDWLLTQIQKICEEYEISEVLYDPYCANKIINDLENSLTLVPIPQHLKSLSPFTKTYEKEILDGNIVDGNPVMAWCMSNAMVYTDANGNIKVLKNSRMGKDVKDLHIDPVITSLMTVGRIKSLLDQGEIDLRDDEQRAADLQKLLSSMKWS